MQTHPISVLIPTYNRAAMLRESIHSILNQTYRKLKIIIYDDGSNDKTPIVVKKFNDNRIVYIRADKNLGVQNARNALLNAAKTKIVCWQDSDDISNIHRIEKQLHYLIESGAILVGTNYIGFTDKIEKKHDIKVVTTKAAQAAARGIPISTNVEKIKYPCGCFASTMFYLNKAVEFDVRHSFGGGDTVWLRKMYRKHNTNRPIMHDILYYVRYHKHRIGRWKKQRQLNPKWLNRMKKLSRNPSSL
jgi:glycosyltransferase involved in cell wall biosynthesis